MSYRVDRSGPGPAQLHIRGEIDAKLARDITADLRTLSGRPVEILIDSIGGEYPAAVQIYNQLRRHAGGVTCIVDGFAGSAASMIAVAGEQTLMRPGSRMMIHDVRSPDTIGPAHKAAEVAVVLTGMANDLAGVYAYKAGGTAEEWRQRMIAETAFTAAEAVEWRLADAIDWSREPVTAPAAPTAIWYLPSRRRRAANSWGALGASPFTGFVDGTSATAQRHNAAMLRCHVINAVASAKREQEEELRRQAPWIATCIAHSLTNQLASHPLGRQILAAAATRANR